MRKMIAATILAIVMTATAARAEGTMKITNDYNVLEVQDGPSTYKIGVERLKEMLRAKAKEDFQTGDVNVVGTIELKDKKSLSTLTGSWIYPITTRERHD